MINGNEIIKTLINLLEDQEQIKITYEIKEHDTNDKAQTNKMAG